MATRMEQLKQKMKEDYAKKEDQYFAECEELKEHGKFDIDGVEKGVFCGAGKKQNLLNDS